MRSTLHRILLSFKEVTVQEWSEPSVTVTAQLEVPKPG